MPEISSLNLLEQSHSNDSFQPIFFKLSGDQSEHSLLELAEKSGKITIHNHFEEQIKELIKCANPGKPLNQEFYETQRKNYLGTLHPDHCGVWVYYPWNNAIVHILDEDDFITVRTNRNKHKITQQEQELLRTKSIGVIGLSVGQSIALTLAMERTCGELRLADFDTVELSNLNRIRTGLQNLGLKKVILAAREIAEIDPFIKVRIFEHGITDNNVESFFNSPTKLDLLVEVCDGIDVKISSRYKARELGIPVVMDTNDRGMLDVERFDLDPQRPVLHGLADGLNPNTIGELTNEQKIPYVLDIVDSSRISSRLKATMLEIGNTVGSWPQLASSVVLGGAITTDICRRILLNEHSISGRFYVDLDDIVSENTALYSNTTKNKTIAHSVGFEQTIKEAIIQSPLDATWPFRLITNHENDEAIKMTLSNQHFLNAFEAGVICSALIHHPTYAIAKPLSIDLPGHPTFNSSVEEIKKIAQTSLEVVANTPLTAEIIEQLAILERIMHFSPSYHAKKYGSIYFKQPAAHQFSFEESKWPAFAKSAYMMLSDINAIHYLSNWNLGQAISKITSAYLSGYSQLSIYEMPESVIEQWQLGVKIGAGKLHNQPKALFTAFSCAEVCTDLDAKYNHELINTTGNLMQLFNLYSTKKHLISLQ